MPRAVVGRVVVRLKREGRFGVGVGGRGKPFSLSVISP